ncbi:MAG: MBL fold metallo-hydrolase [Planctomycetota bacterium]
MTTTIQFLGAARSVTGSKYLLVSNGTEVLVDCGLFQGRKELRLRNWDPMPISPKKIDAVVLTHGHIDHCGYLPRLMKQGFHGPVYASEATQALLELLLPDAGHLQEEEARYANEKGFSKHKPALPLYTAAEGEEALKLVRSLPYLGQKEIAKGFSVSMRPAGHILGSASVEMNVEGRRILFSGDLGGYEKDVMQPPMDLPADVDYLLVESTYGGRAADHRPIRDQLRDSMLPFLEKTGVVLIPAFAIGRTTLVLYHLRRLMDEGELPQVPIFVDSPMATEAVKIYCKFGDEHNLKINLLMESSACPLTTPDIHLVRSVEQSKKLNHLKGPAVIISASGMATGGRVVHHLKRRLPYKENLILLVGFQAYGTRGRLLLEGVDELKMLGEMIKVRAKIESVQGLSAHGDADEVIRWMGTANRPPRMTYLVHGEDEALAAMAERVSTELHFPYYTPDYAETVSLT